MFITSGELFKNLEDCLNDCLKILIDDEVKDFVAINFSEYFKPTREKLCSKLSDEKNHGKVVELLYVSIPDEVEKYVEMMQPNSSDICVYCYNVEILNFFDPELQLIKTKPMIKNKFKEFLRVEKELKKFKV